MIHRVFLFLRDNVNSEHYSGTALGEQYVWAEASLRAWGFPKGAKVPFGVSLGYFSAQAEKWHAVGTFLFGWRNADKHGRLQIAPTMALAEQ